MEALKSIFDQNFTDCRTVDVWQVWRPPEFEILILPENSTQGYSQAYVSVVLKIKFTPRYPEQKPELSFQNPEGLSKVQLQDLQTRLDVVSTELEGNEMVYELCVEASQQLARFNVKKFTSFAEEREDLHRRKAAQREEGQKTLENIKRQAVAVAVAKRKLEIVEEKKKMKDEEERRRTSESWDDGGVSSDLTAAGVRRRRRLTETEECEERGQERLLSVRGEKVNVVVGRLLGRNSLGQATHAAFCTSTGTLLALSRWLVAAKQKKHNRKVKFEESEGLDVGRTVVALEQEMNSLQKLKHPQLVSYLGLTYSTKEEGVVVYLAQEFVSGVDLSGYLSGTRRMDLDMARQVCQDVLQALSHLHAANIVHRDIRDTSIFMDNYGSFRLADFSLDKKLRELLEEKNGLAVEEVFPQSVGRGGKKADIYRVGLLLLSLALGRVVRDQFPAIPANIPDSMQDFVRNCLARDEKSRWSADQLLDHSFVKEPILDFNLVMNRDRDQRDQSPQRSLSPDDNTRSNLQLSMAPTQGQSRLQQDFEILTWIGRGGFGDVIKVKNKLDEKKYAIKRIRLNPADKATNRKIMREVKLLSRLNHENVVRYYNSWHEVTTLPPDTGVTETETEGNTDTGAAPSVTRDSCRAPVAPSEVSSVEWSVSFMPQSSGSEDSESEEEDEWYGPAVRQQPHSSSFIVFGGDSGSRAAASEEVDSSAETSRDEQSSSLSSGGARSRQFHYMYIQMEFCDKQTLRNCIDNDLFKDTTKVWRMFREIVEGLVHIHTQGMIHRDLKPVNIFIDSKDHVKIGDFGLATAGLISHTNKEEAEAVTSDSTIAVEEDMTGQIGTAMYVAPELGANRVTSYNQKVDLYSLGIIFFEMCYPPLATGMERIKVLTSLRSSDIVLPSDWDQETRPQQTFIVKWLLDHAPMSRPTSDQLLQSDWLPPVIVEESIMNTMVRNAMKNTSSKAYKHLIEAVMKQPVSLDKDISYDTETPKLTVRHAAATQHVVERARRVLELHGAVCVESVPSLLPRGEDWPHAGTESAVVAMTRAGDVVSLPHDLRTQWARHLARSRVTQLKRYAIGKVLRERKIFGVHPRELTECAVDIVTPSGGDTALADAEVLVLCQDIVQSAAASWANSRLYLRLSHHGLVTGILHHFGVTGEAEQKVVRALQLWDSLPNRANGQVAARLQAMGFTEQVASSLAPLLEVEVGLSQLGSILRLVTKRKGEAAETVKAALAELKRVEAGARELGLGLETVYCARPGQGLGYVSGLLLQLVRVRHAKSGNKTVDILAAGGRYDSLVRSFADNLRLADPELDAEQSPRACGVSISVDKLVTMVAKSEEFKIENARVVVGGDVAEASRVVRELWSCEVKAMVCSSATSYEASEVAKDHGAEFVVMMAAAADGVALVSQIDRDGRIVALERRFSSGDVVAHLRGCVRKGGETSDQSVLARQESSVSQNYSSASSGPVVNYNFEFLDREKYSQSQKKMVVRKSEKLATALEKFDSHTHVEVISVGYPDPVVRTMASVLDLDTDLDQLVASLEELIKLYPRHRKEFRLIVEEIGSLRFTPKSPVIVLFSLDDNTFRIMC